MLTPYAAFFGVMRLIVVVLCVLDNSARTRFTSKPVKGHHPGSSGSSFGLTR